MALHRTVERLSSIAPPGVAVSRWRRRIVWLAASLSAAAALSAPATLAQDSASASPQINHEFWGFRDGAPQVVESLAQTADGYLWLGTESGLYRFDGVRFERFQSPFGDRLPATDVACLFAPRAGGLWIGYRLGGLFSFLSNGKLTNYKFASTTGTVQGFAEDRHGILWAGSTHGLWRFDGSSWQQNPYGWNAHWSVAQVGFDRDGILWVLTERKSTDVGRQLFYLPPNRTEFLRAAGSVFVEGFTWDADRRVLTTPEAKPAAPGSGVELDGPLPAYPILRKNSEQTLDRADGIWFVSSYDPLFRHPAGPSPAQSIGEAERRNSRSYDFDAYRYSRLVDREGSVWIGTTLGIHRFSYSPLMQLEVPESHGWFAVAPDEGGAVWVSTGTGTGESVLYRVLGDRIESQQPQRGVANLAYRAPDRTFWFGGEGGLWHRGMDGRLASVPLPPALANADNAQYLQAIAQDRAGAVWVAFWNRGIYRLADGVWTASGGLEGLPRQRVYVELRDHLGRIWFGSRNNVVAVLDGERVRTFGPSEGVQVGEVTAIAERGSRLWIGGESGLQYLDNGRFHSIQAMDAEVLQGISGIIETATGDLWLNSLNGIAHVARGELLRALEDPAYPVSVEHFGRSQGLPGLAPPIRPLPSAVEGTDGRLWFTVNNGIVWLDPAHASNAVVPPPVSIQSVSGDDRAYRLDAPIRLTAGTSSVQIGYAAVSLASPDAVHTRYRLREVDGEWHEAAASNVVSYRNLAPGSYHFLVSARDRNGRWSDPTAVAAFTLLPALYQTIWFRSGCALALLALLGLGYRLRLRRLHRQFELNLSARLAERARIARDLHDSLLQSVQGALLHLHAAMRLLPAGASEARAAFTAGVEHVAAAVSDGRKAIQGLRDSVLENDDILEALRALAEPLRLRAGEGAAPVEIRVRGVPRALRPVVRGEVLRIVDEALRNALAHAQATLLEVEIGYERRRFRLRVGDNGVGIDAVILSAGGRAGHFGISGMRERAKLCGGTLNIWSRAGTGTEIELIIPAARAFIPRTTRRSRLLRRLFGASRSQEG